MAGAINSFRSNDSVAASNALTNATNSLGQDEFLKLLLTELRYQDSMNPVQDKEFIAQLAQFSSLEQMQSLSSAFEKFVSYSSTTQLLGLLGRGVTGTTAEGQVKGVATGIRYVEGAPVVTIEDEAGETHELKMDQISQVELVLLDASNGATQGA